MLNGAFPNPIQYLTQVTNHINLYKDDLFIPVKIRALMINEAVSNGLHIARDVLGSVNRYCIYEGNNELVIEFWHNDESIKLIHSDKPSEAVMRYYDAERSGLVKCFLVANLIGG